MSYKERIQDLADAELNRHLDGLEPEEDPIDVLEEVQKCCECGRHINIHDYHDDEFEKDVNDTYWVLCHYCDEDTDLKRKLKK